MFSLLMIRSLWVCSVVKRIAHRDALTGLVNRRGVDKAMTMELNKALKEKPP
jgi:GGDEF domain-containing protein